MSQVWHLQQLRATIPSLLLLCAIGLALLLILPAYYTASPHHHEYRHRLHPHHSAGGDALGGIEAHAKNTVKVDDTHWSAKHHHQGRHRHYRRSKRLESRQASDSADWDSDPSSSSDNKQTRSPIAVASSAFPAAATEQADAVPSMLEGSQQLPVIPESNPLSHEKLAPLASVDSNDDAKADTSSAFPPGQGRPHALASQTPVTGVAEAIAKPSQAPAGAQGQTPSTNGAVADVSSSLTLVTASPVLVYGGRWAPVKERATLTSLGAPAPLAYSPSLLPLAGRRLLVVWVGATFEGAEDASIYKSTCMLLPEGGGQGSGAPHAQGASQGRPAGACMWSEPVVAAKVHRNVPFAGITASRMPPKRGGEPHWSPVLFCGDGPHPAGRAASSGTGRVEVSGTNNYSSSVDGGGSDSSPKPSTSGGRGPSLLPPPRECGGSVWLFFKLGWSSARWETFLSRSSDGGASWGPARPLVKGDIGGRGPTRSKPAWLSEGSILAGGGLDGPMGKEARVHRAFVDRSTDGGATWQRSKEIRPQDRSWGVTAPTLWESKAGALHMLMGGRRVGGKGKGACMWRADSADYGRSWSEPYATRLPSNGAPPDLAHLRASGTLVLAYSPGPSGSTPLRLAISDDNGKTWPLSLDIETEKGENAEFSDPALVAWPQEWGGQEGVLLAYSWHKARPVIFSISLEEIRQKARKNDMFCSLP